MPFRFRLTILYTALIGGILLIVGMATFLSENARLISQVDSTVDRAYAGLVKNWRIGSNGEVVPGMVSGFDLTATTGFQVWNRDGHLSFSSPNLGMLNRPLDSVGFQSGISVYHDSYEIEGRHLRVLTVPLEAGDRPVGTVQVATSMDLVDEARIKLFDSILAIVALGILCTAVTAWFAVGQALAPLAGVTETALQISRADDLSQRIPNPDADNDETGRLIAAFNETLERLEQIFTSQQRFLADVSHELRTPLTVIKGSVALMRRLKQVDSESLDSIEDESDRLTRLVGNLLLETQAESGKLPLHFAPVELDTLLLEVFKEMRVLARDRVNIKLTEIDQIAVNGDRDRLKQVLINLISNAIKYTPKDGTVYLSLARVGDTARLIVRDTGQGISAEDLPHIFERFYRAEKSRTRSRPGGFGLGLSISYWIIKNHGGRIEVGSSEDQGSTFCIYLPIPKVFESSPTD
ncbi:MAG TPA: HAMP domain-containing sensor histidine kinase [Anaerolineales bacterium]|nr:HAMP domain-containing sensor histidine kinase [Anaerolineales bacterium]